MIVKILLLISSLITINAMDILDKYNNSDKKVIKNILINFTNEELNLVNPQELVDKIENIRHAAILFDENKLENKKFKTALDWNKKILKYQFFKDSIKKKFSISTNDYQDFFDTQHLLKNKRYDVLYLSLKNKKTALNLSRLLTNSKNYKELQVSVNKFIFLNDISRQKLILKEIKAENLRDKIKNTLVHISPNQLYTNKILKMNGKYYFILISKIYPPFTFDDFLSKMDTEPKYKQNIDNYIFENYFSTYMNKLKELRIK